ncbi:hypothetical protein ACFRFH_09185 [Leifsonia sp. NPDC056824]|uniref:hypothetical protein n=1 Tax=Leifsonia sp. NPDC056824 TaxID=3345953 RepID=UPI0036B41479
MTANPAGDLVLRLLEEAGLADDAALAAVLGEIAATAAEEPPAPSRDVVRLMSGRRPARSWFARRGARTTTVVLLAAALAGGASAAAAASPAFHTVVGDAFSSLAKLVGPPAHPTPDAPRAPASGHDAANEANPSPRNGGDRPGSTSAGAGDAHGSQAAPPPTAVQEQPASGTQLGAGSQAAGGGAGASGDDPGRSGGTSSGSGQGASGGQGDDQGGSKGSSTQKQAPLHHEPAPAPSPAPPAAGSQTSQPGGGSAGSDR